ncbi:MAG: hypothetical protein IH621_13795 [Krumholzibacteria bacterium]|nr:hypothetical protein [Candidatus Krumholzibacteria bacterium]
MSRRLELGISYMCQLYVLAAFLVPLLVAWFPAASFSGQTSDPQALLAVGDYVSRSRAPLRVHAWRGSVAAAGIDSILASRHQAFAVLCNLLEVTPPDSVNLIFYPDEPTKFTQTGHRGLGWGVGTTVIEVLNDSIQVDSYHELAHIALYQIGLLPAMWDEGFAVYVSALLGADALRNFGYPGGRIDDSLRDHLAGGEPYAWCELAALEDIGDATDVLLAYLQSASLVGFVAEEYGDESLRDVLRNAAKRSPRDALERSNEALLSSVGRSGLDVWTLWRSRLDRASDRLPTK